MFNKNKPSTLVFGKRLGRGQEKPSLLIHVLKHLLQINDASISNYSFIGTIYNSHD